MARKKRRHRRRRIGAAAHTPNPSGHNKRRGTVQAHTRWVAGHYAKRKKRRKKGMGALNAKGWVTLVANGLGFIAGVYGGISVNKLIPEDVLADNTNQKLIAGGKIVVGGGLTMAHELTKGVGYGLAAVGLIEELKAWQAPGMSGIGEDRYIIIAPDNGQQRLAANVLGENIPVVNGMGANVLGENIPVVNGGGFDYGDDE